MGAAWGWKVAGLFIFKTSFLRLFQRYSRAPNYFLIWGFSNIRLSGYLGYEAPSHPRSSPYPRHLRYRAPSNLRLLKSEASQIWGFSDLRLLRLRLFPYLPRPRRASNVRLTCNPGYEAPWDPRTTPYPRHLRYRAPSNLRLLRSEASQIWGFSGQVIAPL